MRALVTGGTGFLGAALLHRLAAEGARLRVIVRPGSDATILDRIDAAYPQAALQRVACGLDAGAAGLDAALDDIDVVFHLASAMSGGTEAVMRGTLATSAALLDALARRPAPPRVVLVGSLAVLDTASLAEGANVDDDTPLEPRPALRDAYTDAKLQQERMFRDRCARHRIPLVVARPGVLYGPGRAAPSTRVGFGPLAGWFLLLGGDNPLPLAHVDNCAAALAWIARHADFAGEAVNIVDQPQPGCREYLLRYRAAQRPGLRILPVPAPLGRLAASLLPWLHARSRGRVPLLLSPYRWRSSWRPFRYGSTALARLGFVAPLSAEAALATALDAPCE